MSEPVVSVIMPVFNGRHYAEQAIDSILNQTFQNFELLIVDDASTDESWTILKKYRKQYPDKVSILKLKKNGGAFAATNIALEKARGKYIALMDSDDIALPQRLEKQLQFLESHPEVLVLGGQVNIIDDKGQIVAQKNLPLNHQQIYRSYALIHPMVHPACMVRKLLSNGERWKYHNRFGVNDDYFTFFTLLSKGQFANLDEYILNYRIHFKNSSLVKLKKCFLNTLKIRWAMFTEYNYSFSLLQLLLITAQAAVVFITPQSFIFKVYLLCRNIRQDSQQSSILILPKYAKRYVVALNQVFL